MKDLLDKEISDRYNSLDVTPTETQRVLAEMRMFQSAEDDQIFKLKNEITYLRGMVASQNVTIKQQETKNAQYKTALQSIFPLAKARVEKLYAYSCDSELGESWQEARDKAAVAAAYALFGQE